MSLPYLNAPAAGAHVLPQQQVVQRSGGDVVGELVENLLHLGGGQRLARQSCVKSSQLPQERRHAVAVASHHPGVRVGSLSGRGQLRRRAGKADGLALQQSGN